LTERRHRASRRGTRLSTPSRPSARDAGSSF